MNERLVPVYADGCRCRSNTLLRRAFLALRGRGGRIFSLAGIMSGWRDISQAVERSREGVVKVS